MVLGDLGKVWEGILEFGEDVAGEVSVVGAKFEKMKGAGRLVGEPEGVEAVGEDFPEGGTDRDAGDEVAFF